MSILVAALLSVLPLAQSLALGQSQAPAETPVKNTIDPPNAKVVYRTRGEGVQIYLCAQQRDGMQWVLKGPAATLTDAATGAQVGRHGDGPQWTWSDGSAVRGHIIGRRAAPDPANIPWLLLATDPFPGLNGPFDKPGALDHIQFVQRSDTHGGLAPTAGCDAAHIGDAQSVPYSATYTFYTRTD
jgi:hypothetical protein